EGRPLLSQQLCWRGPHRSNPNEDGARGEPICGEPTLFTRLRSWHPRPVLPRALDGSAGPTPTGNMSPIGAVASEDAAVTKLRENSGLPRRSAAGASL